MLRLAINGYGRIGRSILRALYESELRQRLQVVAINELADARTVLHLTRYDSTHGRFPLPLEGSDTQLQVAGDRIALLHQPDVARLPWDELGVDLVLECTGAFSDRATAEQHLHRGAGKVLFSQPAQGDVDATVVFGINHDTLYGGQQIVSAASCTTNGIVPVIHALDRALGIVSGTITTIHSAMNDQPVLDAYHNTDLRKTRAASQSIIPVDTALAKGVERILPELVGRFTAQALRVPTLNVSAMDLTVQVRRDTSEQEVNRILCSASESAYNGVLGYTAEPLASCDFNHDSRSSIVDASQTRVSGGQLVKVLTWFDNEWAYANRMLDVAAWWGSLPQRPPQSAESGPGKAVI
ncbi:glyceraldehyde 3-phosphate dehydrogenase NAD-binding domain-containing protein [Kineobactrum salinum]|uniref:Erythrose-4-phosphate dehydrogenase n=1 Tax=Kineobactrum salinum TaxID=2708301 RepID=A0A6C0U0H1_9GAMM|nr:glyceraldehyde 3-phosphate dehydrogenase NAD-binding domain-containing protein [Kineobactrum salinum]QIB65506.1 erythrose-4-phosphate dehydrogenase [Kineobactrum salinum]